MNKKIKDLPIDKQILSAVMSVYQSVVDNNKISSKSKQKTSCEIADASLFCAMFILRDLGVPNKIILESVKDLLFKIDQSRFSTKPEDVDPSKPIGDA